jgi:ABC-type Fe3+ transport system permease subunit
MKNGLTTTFVIVFLFVIKEFPMTALVYSSDTLTLAVRTFSLYEGGSFEKTGAASILLLALTFLILVLANKVSRISVESAKI